MVDRTKTRYAEEGIADLAEKRHGGGKAQVLVHAHPVDVSETDLGVTSSGGVEVR